MKRIALYFLVLTIPTLAGFSLLPPTFAFDADKCDRGHKLVDKFCAKPTPAPTLSPSPTAAVDCSDGTFTLGSTGYLELLHVTTEPGRTYHWCLPIPPSFKASIVQLQAVNDANMNCNDRYASLVAPNGLSFSAHGEEPGTAAPFQPGTWGLSMVLVNDPASLCSTNKGISLYFSWF